MPSATVASQFHPIAQVQRCGDPIFAIRHQHDTAAVRGSRLNRFLQGLGVIGFAIPHCSVVLNVEQIDFGRLADSIVGVLKRRQRLIILMLAIHRATAEEFGLTGHGAVNEFSDSVSNRDRTFSTLDVCGVNLVVGAVLSPDAIFGSLQSAPHDPEPFGVVHMECRIAISDGEVRQFAAGIIPRDASLEVESFLIPGDLREPGIESIHLVDVETGSVFAHISCMRAAFGRTSRQPGPGPVVR